jgi:glutathione S-transferase
MSSIKVYYWPFLARGASLVRMLEHTGTPYEFISDKAEMAKVCSSFGATGTTFAPPVLVDGDYTIAQSGAATLYLGHKLGLTPEGYDQFKATQYILDIVDTFEGGIGKSNEDGATLKAYLTGPRFASQMGNIERSIAGPFYFGAEPSAVDFYLLMHLEMRTTSIFGPLRERFGFDALAAFPKVAGVYAALLATDAYKNYAAGESKYSQLPHYLGPLKDEILAAFAPAAPAAEQASE